MIVKFLKIAHCEFFSKEEFPAEFCDDNLSDSQSDIYSNDSENDNFSEYFIFYFRSDSDDINIRLTKKQKTFVIDSDSEHEDNIHEAGENSSFSTEN